MPDEDKTTAGDVLIVIGWLGLIGGNVYLFYKVIKGLLGHSADASQPIDFTFANTVLKDLIAELKLDPGQGKANRHRHFFIHRRARALGIANAELRQGPGLEKLKQQLKVELKQVDQFLEERLGTEAKRGPYFGGSESLASDLRHLDLGKYVSVRLNDPKPTTEKEAVDANTPDQSQAETLRELERRRIRVFGIVLRGVALNEKVWTGTGTDSKLQPAALFEILDRRLRTVERLHYEASAGATPDGIGPSFIRRGKRLRADTTSNESDGWFDDIKHRIFEAPSMPRPTPFDFEIKILVPMKDAAGKPLKDAAGLDVMETVFSGDLEAALIELKMLLNDPGAPRYGLTAATSRAWYQNHTTDEMDWNAWPGTRLKAPLILRPNPEKPSELIPFEMEWKRVEDSHPARGYGWIMKPRRSAVEVIKELFQVPSLNLWARSWLHSDGVMSALHLEALQFALRRGKAKEIDAKKTDDERKREEAERLKEEAEDKRLELEEKRPGLTDDERNEIAKKRLKIFEERIERNAKQVEEINRVFNALPGRFDLALDDYFEVRRRVIRAPKGIMIGKTDHFENSAVEFDDLQIGDQVLFESTPALRALGSTDWDYPTILVTDLDYLFPRVIKIDPAELTMQGFGTTELDQTSLQLLLAKAVDLSLQGVREHIKSELEKQKKAAEKAALEAKAKGETPKPFVPPEKVAWDPGMTTREDSLTNSRFTLRFWNPYGDTWDDPGPWWIWINMEAPVADRAFGDDALKTLGQTPGGLVWLEDKKQVVIRSRFRVSETIPTGQGFQDPPFEALTDEGPPNHSNKVIFVPLFEPNGGWITYFKDKAANPNVKRGPTLTPVVSDSSWLPGLAMSGDKVRVIRPIV